MSGWKTHLTGGFVLVVLFLAINYFYPFVDVGVNVQFYVFTFFIIVFFSLAPDLDHRLAKLRGIVTFLALIVILLSFITGETNRGIAFTITLLVLEILPYAPGFGHRGHYHSLIFGLLLAAPIVYFLSYQLAIVSYVAFLSHLLLDKEVKIW